MTLKYDKFFTTVGPINHNSAAVLVRYLENGDTQAITIQRYEGEYNSTEEFNEATDRFFDNLQKIVDRVPMGNPTKAEKAKLYSSIVLSLSDTQRLVDALTGALQAAQGLGTAPSRDA